MKPKTSKPEADEDATPPEADEDATPPEADEDATPPEADEVATLPEADEVATLPEADEVATPPEADEGVAPLVVVKVTAENRGLLHFFEDVLPALPENATFYQPAAYEHYGSATVHAPNGELDFDGWRFTIQDKKLLFAEKLPVEQK